MRLIRQQICTQVSWNLTQTLLLQEFHIEQMEKLKRLVQTCSIVQSGRGRRKWETTANCARAPPAPWDHIFCSPPYAIELVSWLSGYLLTPSYSRVPGVIQAWKSVIPTEDFRGFLSGPSRKYTDSTSNWVTAAIHIPQNSFHNLSSFL
jgi:hypothetical protein